MEERVDELADDVVQARAQAATRHDRRAHLLGRPSSAFIMLVVLEKQATQPYVSVDNMACYAGHNLGLSPSQG